LVQSNIFRNNDNLIVVLEIIDKNDLIQVKTYLKKLFESENPVKIEKVIVIFGDESIAYQFDRLIKKFDKAQIELLILSKKYRQHKKRLAESLLTELRKIFYGSASIY